MKYVFFQKWSFLLRKSLRFPTLTITSVGTNHHLAYPGLTCVVFSISFEPSLPLNRNLVAFLSKLVTVTLTYPVTSYNKKQVVGTY